jgi:hypothetical protein
VTKTRIDDDVLETYVKSLIKSAEYYGKFINYIELRSLIRRFMTLNPHLDPKVVDWVGVWDDRLTYSEQVRNFKEHYPMYKWQDDTVVAEEAFESAKKAKLKRIIEELDEESLRELVQLIQKELGWLPQTQTEKKKEPAIQTSTITSTHTVPSAQQPAEPKEPKITLRVLAGVPVLLEARAFVNAFSVEELCQTRLLREARGRIMAGLEDFVWPFGDPLRDLLSFYLAALVLSQIQDRRVWERFAINESRRAEDFMNAAVNDEVLEVIWRDFLIRAARSGPDEEERTGLPYKIHVTDYLRLVKGIDGAEWRLENRTVWRGWVYVTRRELVRLISEEVKARILRRLEEVKVDKVPEPIKETAERIRTTLAIRFARATTDKQTTQTPP